MANVDIHDAILHKILVRLPAKSLLRFRCVSRHWNHMITDPYFMKSRSRRMIILSTSRLHVIDYNLSTDDLDHSILNLSSPFEQEIGTEITVVGTFNGIVLLVLTTLFQIPHIKRVPSRKNPTIRMILYNPLTHASKELVRLPRHSFNDTSTYACGFGYGATPDDLKIVRIEGCEGVNGDDRCTYHVFDVKKSSWSTPRYTIQTYNFYNGMADMFLNGFLYWVASNKIDTVILALNVKEMVFSEIDLPHQRNCTSRLLGSLNGCLCMINRSDFCRFEVWVMKEHGWSKACSFTLSLEDSNRRKVFYPVYVLDNGRILMADSSSNIFIFDISKHSTESLISVSVKNFEIVRGIEYVESLVSPWRMCVV